MQKIKGYCCKSFSGMVWVFETPGRGAGALPLGPPGGHRGPGHQRAPGL